MRLVGRGNRVRKHRIAIFNLNETRRDPRVLRIADTLRRAGHSIRVFEMSGGAYRSQDTIGELEVCQVPVPQRYGIAEMKELARISPEAASLIEGCEPLVMSMESWHRNARVVLEYVKENFGHLRHRLLAKPSSSPLNLYSDVLSIRSIMLLNLELFKAAREFEPSFVIANDLNTLVAGYMMHCSHQVPVLYDAHEIYPEQLPYEMRSNFWHKFYTTLEQALCKFPVGVMTVCDSIADYFDKVYGREGVISIWNVPSLDLRPDASILERRNERRVILYHGAYFKYRGLDEVIAASKFVENADFVFRGIGNYENELKRQASKLGVDDRVRFLSPVPVMDLVPKAAECDIGLNPFINVCKNTEFALPNKFFEYTMAGLALVSSDLVEMRSLTKKYKLGRLFDSLDPQAMADTLNEFLSDPGAIDECRYNSYFTAGREFNWQTQEEKFLTFFSEIAAA